MRRRRLRARRYGMSNPSPLKEPARLVSERLIAIHRVWRNIAGDRVAPSRAEITPARTRALTASTWIMDVIESGADFRFRFAGDRIIQCMGRRVAGVLLSDVRGEPFFDGMHALLSASVTGRHAVALGPIPSSYAGKEHLEFEALVMPLLEQDGAITAVFGGFDTWPLGTHLAKKR